MQKQYINRLNQGQFCGHGKKVCSLRGSRNRQVLRHRRYAVEPDALPLDKALQIDTQGPIDIPSTLNQTPYKRSVRWQFYLDAAESLMKAIAKGETRIKLELIVPEFDRRRDVFRAGSVLELVRYMTRCLTLDSSKVRVVMQGFSGTGRFASLPLYLYGIKAALGKMDWQEEVEPFVEICEIGSETIVDDVKYYIIIMPSNTSGACVVDGLIEMMTKMDPKKHVVVILNPNTDDIPSIQQTGGMVMGAFGAKEREDFMASFQLVYLLTLVLYGDSPHPIRGMMRRGYGEDYELYKLASKSVLGGAKDQEFVMMGNYTESPAYETVSKELSNYGKEKDKGAKWW